MQGKLIFRTQPLSLLLLGAGLIGLAGLRLRRHGC